jgi:polyphosphate glucokinase
MQNHQILGVDVGASGVKGAIIDVKNGELQSERLRLPTPRPADPAHLAETFAELVGEVGWSGAIGCGFPAIIKNGEARSAANISKAWIGQNVEELFSEVCGSPVYVINDADAAGLAEMRFGVGKEQKGVVVLVTIGSGLGSALFIDGQLVPNTEFGHLYLRNMVAEHFASNSTRKKYDLSWEAWGPRFNEYLEHLQRILTPDLFILSGGISKRFEEYKAYLNVDTPVVPARLLNNAGIVGAACHASESR